MLDYVKQIPSDSHIAIFTLADTLRMLQGFTTDPALLKAALNKNAYPAVSALSRQGLEASRNDGLRLGGVQVQGINNSSAVRASLDRFMNEPQNFQQELRIRYTIDALNAMSVYLAGIEGRKDLVWFAGSVPWTINPDFSIVSSVTGRIDYADQLKKLANVMTIGRISIYPVDARALMVTPGGLGANNAGSEFAQRGQGRDVNAFGNDNLRTLQDSAGDHMSMENLARATGGRAYFNTNALASTVVKVQSMGENYYTIAYSPKDKRYDGGFRGLQVILDDPALKLDYRRGYYAVDPAKTTGRTTFVTSNPLRAVMLRGAPDATQIPFQVRVKLATEQPDPAKPNDRVGNNAATLKGSVVRYEFHWTVDLHGVEFTIAANGLHHAEVDATVAAYDEAGKILNTTYAELPLDLTDAAYTQLLKAGLPMKQIMDVPTGNVYLRTGVLDPSTQHTGATEFPMAVGAVQSPGARHTEAPWTADSAPPQTSSLAFPLQH